MSKLTTEEIIDLAQILIPVVEKGAVEVAKLIATMNAEITAERLAELLDESKSKSWPRLDFGQ